MASLVSGQHKQERVEVFQSVLQQISSGATHKIAYKANRYFGQYRLTFPGVRFSVDNSEISIQTFDQ